MGGVEDGGALLIGLKRYGTIARACRKTRHFRSIDSHLLVVRGWYFPFASGSVNASTRANVSAFCMATPQGRLLAANPLQRTVSHKPLLFSIWLAD